VRQQGILVVKLGGSLAGAPVLADWLKVLAQAGGRSVIVPGGGPFADQVRNLQRELGFDDATAHHLALLAMEQFGRILAALQPGLAPASNREEIDKALDSGQVPVWMPTEMTLDRPEIPESWQVTSDSLAAWLAGALNADRLVLVGRSPPPSCLVWAWSTRPFPGSYPRAVRPPGVWGRIRPPCWRPD
jgi:dihydroneopterin aldolase